MIGKNNPFNIRYNPLNHWIGQTGNTRGFCDFSSLVYGIRAAAYLILRTYKRKGVMTISEIVNRFAPNTENDTDKYISFLCDKLDMLPFDKPSNYLEYAVLLEYMSQFEGNKVDKFIIINVLRNYFKNEDFC